jgi:hypothetical protein
VNFFYLYSRYRTPLCILYPPKIIAVACYVLAQRIHDGPNSPSLDARISATAPSMSLPTPPSHKPPSPDATRFAIEHFQLNESELSSVAGMIQKNIKLHNSQLFLSIVTLTIILDFYGAQDMDSNPYIKAIVSVRLSAG